MRRSGAHSRSRSQVLQKRDTVVPTCIPSQAPIDRSLAVTAFKPHAIRHTHTARAPYLSRSAPSSHSPHPLHYTPTPKPHSLLHSKSSNFKFPRSCAPRSEVDHGELRAEAVVEEGADEGEGRPAERGVRVPGRAAADVGQVGGGDPRAQQARPRLARLLRHRRGGRARLRRGRAQALRARRLPQPAPPPRRLRRRRRTHRRAAPDDQVAPRGLLRRRRQSHRRRCSVVRPPQPQRAAQRARHTPEAAGAQELLLLADQAAVQEDSASASSRRLVSFLHGDHQRNAALRVVLLRPGARDGYDSRAVRERATRERGRRGLRRRQAPARPQGVPAADRRAPGGRRGRRSTREGSGRRRGGGRLWVRRWRKLWRGVRLGRAGGRHERHRGGRTRRWRAGREWGVSHGRSRPVRMHAHPRLGHLILAHA